MKKLLALLLLSPLAFAEKINLRCETFPNPERAETLVIDTIAKTVIMDNDSTLYKENGSKIEWNNFREIEFITDSFAIAFYDEASFDRTFGTLTVSTSNLHIDPYTPEDKQKFFNSENYKFFNISRFKCKKVEAIF